MQKLVGSLKAMLPHMEMVAEIMAAHGVTGEGEWWDEGGDTNLDLGSRWYRYHRSNRSGVALVVLVNHWHVDGQRCFEVSLEDGGNEMAELNFSEGWLLTTWPYTPEDGVALGAINVQLNELCAALDKLDFPASPGEQDDVVAREAVNMIVGFFAKLPVQAPAEDEDAA